MQDEGSANQWEGSDRRGMTEAKLRHVNDHLTPLAAIIVIPGLLVAPLPTRAKVAAGIRSLFSDETPDICFTTEDRNATTSDLPLSGWTEDLRSIWFCLS